MSSVECLREFVNERLTAAAEEIFRVFKQTIVQYEEEIDRQRRLLDIIWKPEVQLHRIELPQQHVCKEEEVLADQQLYNQERNSSLDQEEPEPPQIKEEQEEPKPSQIKEEQEELKPSQIKEEQEEPKPSQIKEEQEELCIAQEEEQLVLKQETDTFMWTPTYEESDHIEDQALYFNHDKTESTAESVLFFLLSVPPERPQQYECKEKDVVGEQRLCSQERIYSLDQKEPEPPEVKEEEEELCISQEREQLVSNLLLRETDTFMWTPTYEESDHSEDQALYFNPDKTESTAEKESVVNTAVVTSVVSVSHVAESQNQKGGEHEDSGSTRNAEPEPKNQQNQHHKSRSDSNNANKSSVSDIYCNIHSDKKSFKCDTCGKVFKNKSSFYAHVRTHTGEKPFICKTCGRRFSRMSNLKSHMWIHTGEKPLLCKTCGRRFSRMSHLKSHMWIHTGEKLFLCKTCGQRFSHMSNLKTHMSIHTGERPFLCKTCGRGFSHMSSLKRHMSIHTGEKPLLCKTCGQRFSHMSNLKRHMLIHTGEKPFLCKTCGRGFTRMSELKSHMLIHTGEKLFLCQTCGHRFTLMSHLKRHMLKHTGESEKLQPPAKYVEEGSLG